MMNSIKKKWLIYGANGFTGKLIAAHAIKSGLKPIVAGRNKKSIESLAKSLNIEGRVFDLDDINTIKKKY